MTVCGAALLLAAGLAVKASYPLIVSGGALPASELDLAIDYETLAEHKSIMGSGGMVVMDEDNCMVDVARYFVEFTHSESCGKCIPCRAGTAQMHHLLTKILGRKATARDLEKLEDFSKQLDIIAEGYKAQGL